MRVLRRCFLLLNLLLGVFAPAACQEHNPGGANAFGLRTIDLRLGPAKVVAEVADTPESRSTGLMFRDSLPQDHGMLFVFEHPTQASFWMKNTKIPLSIGFLDTAGTLLEIRDMQPYSETLINSRSDQVAYALETNQGWFRQNHVSVGSRATGLPR